MKLQVWGVCAVFFSTIDPVQPTIKAGLSDVVLEATSLGTCPWVTKEFLLLNQVKKKLTGRVLYPRQPGAGTHPTCLCLS